MERLHDNGDEEQSGRGAEDGTWKHRDGDNDDATARKAREAAEDTDNVLLPCEPDHISEPPPPLPLLPNLPEHALTGVFLNRPRRESPRLFAKLALARILL